MKTKITAINENRVTIKFLSEFGEIVEMDIHATSGGGYVRYGKHNSQLCDRLSFTGNALIWDGECPLIDLVRREYRAMRRAEKND